MKERLAIIAAIAATVICWGIYGPVLHWGKHSMEGSSLLRPFLCVGLAYFLIAVIVPCVFLLLRGEAGRWSAGGVFWSLTAGAAGAIGALGVIMAFQFGGRAVFVMPLVFGGAPVVNTFLTMTITRTVKNVGPIFLAGVTTVVLGSAFVLISKPKPSEAAEVVVGEPSSMIDHLLVIASIAVVVVCWGAYGPILHKGQMRMENSRLRPFICVGAAYFAIAVIVPVLLLGAQNDSGGFTIPGSLLSLSAGAVGALGALGIIMSFNFGGRPIFVMPLVFGGAPVVNTFATIIGRGNEPPSSFFYAGLILVVTGAAMVLVFAPKGHPPPSKDKTEDKPEADPEEQSKVAAEVAGQPAVEKDASQHE